VRAFVLTIACEGEKIQRNLNGTAITLAFSFVIPFLSDMCGISCIVALDGCARQARQQDRQRLDDRLRQSLEQIRYRGPDSTGTWISGDQRVGESFFLMPEHH
jgi:NhaP-type Na+/H+ or K+/H+ antiporter